MPSPWANPLPWTLSPEEALLRWPHHRPLALLWSDHAAPDGRWSIFAPPNPGTSAVPHAHWSSSLPQTTYANSSPESPDLPPFLGGSILALPFETAYDIEPASLPPGGQRLVSRPVVLHAPVALVFDSLLRQWWEVGDGSAPAPSSWLAELPKHPPIYRLGPLESLTGRGRYEESVRQAIDLIAQGDIYQVNLAHLLRAAFTGSTRTFFGDLTRVCGPAHGAYIEAPGVSTIASVSPELFLSITPDGPAWRITTRPIKGTRRADQDAAHLESSDKERAELTMIVDLMRNDLGRICRPGSVVVDHLRRIELHNAGAARPESVPGIWHAVASVSGLLDPRATLHSILSATFPPGSVTGCPKIRAAQIIRELEPEPRSFYCGAIGYVSAHGRAALNVAIRTAVISESPDPAAPRTLDYGIGAGIVADSTPEHEWQETLDKAQGILSLAAPPPGIPVIAPRRTPAATAFTPGTAPSSAPT